MVKNVKKEGNQSQATNIPNIQGIICSENQEEKEFNELVKLWVDNKISYEFLLSHYPDHNPSMMKKILKSIYRRLD
jgi:hypothetical protein